MVETSLKTIAMKLNSKLQPIILSGQTILVKNNNYLTMWILSLTLGLIGCLMIGLVPFAYNSQFAVIPPPFYRGSLEHMEKVFGKWVDDKADKLARTKAKANLEHERKMFVRHALERRKNMTYEAVGDYLNKTNRPLSLSGQKSTDLLRQIVHQRKERREESKQEGEAESEIKQTNTNNLADKDKEPLSLLPIVHENKSHEEMKPKSQEHIRQEIANIETMLKQTEEENTNFQIPSRIDEAKDYERQKSKHHSKHRSHHSHSHRRH